MAIKNLNYLFPYNVPDETEDVEEKFDLITDLIATKV